MADTGWQYPGTAVATLCDQPPIGGPHTFDVPNNVKLDDGNVAKDAGAKIDGVDPGEGPELVVTNFGFSIPTDNIILGVETRIKGWTDSNIVSELAYLTTDAVLIAGTEKRNDWTDIGDGTSITPTTHVYGSSTDLWSATLTPAIVNSANFGWIFMDFEDSYTMEMNVDYMQMKVYYVPASATAAMVIMIGA